MYEVGCVNPCTIIKDTKLSPSDFSDFDLSTPPPPPLLGTTFGGGI